MDEKTLSVAMFPTGLSGSSSFDKAQSFKNFDVNATVECDIGLSISHKRCNAVGWWW